MRRHSEEHSDVLVAFVKALAMVKVPCQPNRMRHASATLQPHM